MSRKSHQVGFAVVVIVVVLAAACAPATTVAPMATRTPASTSAAAPTFTHTPPSPTSPAPTPIPTPIPTRTPAPTAAPAATPLPGLLRPVIAIEDVLPGAIERLHPAPDGGLWLITDQGVAKLLGNVWTVYLSDFTGSLAGIDVAGRIWVVSEDTATISAWDGDSWTGYGAEAGWLPIALEDGWYREVTDWGQSDGRGRFWLTTSQDVRVFDGERWTVFTPAEMGMGEVGFEDTWPSFVVEVSPSTGTVWVGECDWGGPGPFGGQGARWFDGETWVGADSPVASGCTSAIEEDNLGRVWLNTDEILWRYEPGSGNWTQFAPPEPPVDLMYFRFADTITLDPSGDAWPALVLCGGSCYGNVVLYHIHEEAWTQIGAVAEFEEPRYRLVFDAGGVPRLFWNGSVYRLRGDTPELLADLYIRSVAVDAAGRVWFVAWVEGQEWLWTFDTETVEGYWIQNTTAEGLCSNSPRFIGFDEPHARPYIGGSGATICYLDYSFRTLDKWPHDYPSPIFGLPEWISVTVPNLASVTGGAAFSPYAPANPLVPYPHGFAYGMPGFAGSGGRCVLAAETWDAQAQWRCSTSADGLPFDDVRGYGIAQNSNVEWFMSADSVASHGMQPHDLLYSIPELVGASGARPTWLGIPYPYSQEEDVWVGTNGYGVIRIEPVDGRVTRYTTADGLPGDAIRDVLPRGEQGVWIATDGGVGHWDGARWRTYTTRDGLPSDDVRGVSVTNCCRDVGEDVWAATAGGPALLVAGSDEWLRFPDFPAGVEVNGVLRDDFSTPRQGLLRFVRAPVVRGRITLFTTADGLPDNRITALAQTVNGILVGTPRGTVEWDGHAWARITDAAVNGASSTTIATDAGLWVWNGDAWERVNGERVTRVAKGGWYVTPSQVCRWVDGAADCPLTSAGQPLSGIEVLYADPADGTVVAIDAQNEHWRYAAGRFASQEIETIAEPVNDVIAREGVWHYATEMGVCDSAGGPAWPLADWGLSQGWPVSVRQLSLNPTTSELWIATSQGAFYRAAFDPAEQPGGWTYVALPHRDLTTVLSLPDGSAWFGTADAGVIRFEPVAMGMTDHQ